MKVSVFRIRETNWSLNMSSQQSVSQSGCLHLCQIFRIAIKMNMQTLTGVTEWVLREDCNCLFMTRGVTLSLTKIHGSSQVPRCDTYIITGFVVSQHFDETCAASWCMLHPPYRVSQRTEWRDKQPWLLTRVRVYWRQAHTCNGLSYISLWYDRISIVLAFSAEPVCVNTCTKTVKFVYLRLCDVLSTFK